MAVRWDGPDGPVTGVYIPRRDTSSRLASLLGGRAFPGWQHHARFDVHEDAGRYRIEAASRDRTLRIEVDAHVAETVMPGSVFGGVEAASAFFRCAPVGYAATPAEGVFDGVQLGTEGWGMRPAHVDLARSSFFEDPARFPAGAATLDSAFLMGGLATTWHPQPELLAVPVSPRSRRR